MEKMSVGIMLTVGEDPKESLRKAKQVGVDNVQLGCPPEEYLSGDRFAKIKKAIEESGITITTVFCGFAGESYADIPTIRRTAGFVDPATRGERAEKTKRISDFAKRLNVDKVAAHIGFIPEERDGDVYKGMIEATRQVADHCKENEQYFCLETGQETAETLLGFIKDIARDNIRVNFDPANMILYGSGDPIEALETIKGYVVSVHCKDGVGPTERDKLGTEKPLGEGDVGIERFMDKLIEIGYAGPLTIEREISGPQQIEDIKKAKHLLEGLRNR